MGQRIYPGKFINDEITPDEADTDDNDYLSYPELSVLYKSQISSLAEELGYTLTLTTKAGMIAEFLVEEDEDHVYTEAELTEMDVPTITALAGVLEYTVTETEKAALITEFLAAQEEALNPAESGGGEGG